MALLGPIFFDTSVLIAGLIELGETTDPAQRAMAGVAEGRVPSPTTAWHCCLEFYAVSTRLPEEYRLSPPDSLRLIEEEILARLRVRQLPEGRRRAFFRSAVEDRVAGGRLYDAHIAEIASCSSVKAVVTENRRHFSALSRRGIRVIGSADLVDELRL